MSYTINDIARELNLSHTTVSRVLNNSDKVRPETRRLVLDKIESMGYVPNMIARGLRTQNRMLAVVTQDVLNPYYTESMYAIEKVCRESSFFLLHLNSDNSPAQEERNLYQLLTVKVQGVILLANMLEVSNKYVRLCMEATNVVAIDGDLEGVDSVLSDSLCGIRQAVDCLVERGHVRIGVCHGACRSLPIQTRFDQFKRCLQSKGIEYDDSLTFFTDGSATYIEKLEQARVAGGLPTALFTLNDNVALSVYRWCAQKGVSIPGQLSVLGFDGIEISQLLQPSLSTIAQPIGRIGEQAAELLISRINAGQSHCGGEYQKLFMPTHFILRDSIRDIRQG